MNQSAVEDESAVGQDEPAGHGSAPEAESPPSAPRADPFAADVEYRGSAGPDYVVRVRHRFLDTSFTVVIDGVGTTEAEEKARKKEEGEGEGEGEEGATGRGRRGERPDRAADGLRFRLEEGFTTLRYRAPPPHGR